MLFLNGWLLLGTLAVAVPVAIHLLNRRSAHVEEWGAMRFLVDSMLRRRRRILLEEMLLLACRCLLVALLALALARPFIPEGSRVPWPIVLPLILMAITLFAVSFALWRTPVRRRATLAAATLCAVLAITAVLAERWIAGRLFGANRVRDVALIIDGSASMTMTSEGRVNFERALGEARSLIASAPRGTAFSLIVGGPTPNTLTPAPLSDRAQLYRMLDELRPPGGSMRTLDALAAATLTLAQGHRSGKHMVLIGDGQRVGWGMDRPGHWRHVRDMLARFPSPPQVTIRALPLPSSIRNLAVADIALSRPVVGVDRPVRIDVTLRNTGSESVTPQVVRLRIGEEILTDMSAGQIEPGVERRVSFRHRFERAGAHVIEAEIEADDELAADDRRIRVVQALDRLRVLVVDGSASLRFPDRAGGYVALALTPRPLDEDAGSNGEDERFLVDSEWVPAARLPARLSFDEYALVVLADVPSAPTETAERLAAYVAAGGALMVVHGPRSRPGFYNAWRFEDVPLLPFPLLEPLLPEADEPMARVDPASFAWPALAPFQADTEMARVTLSRLWRLDEDAAAGTTVGARMQDGSPWLTDVKRGRGRVMQVASGLDRGAGNLVAQQVFVPLMHALTGRLTHDALAQLTIEPGHSQTLRLPLSSPAVADDHRGLRAQYFKDTRLRGDRHERIDPHIDFNWGDQAPAPDVPGKKFGARWTGSLMPRVSENYTLTAEADGRMSVWVDGKRIIHGGGSGRIDLRRGRAHDLRVDYAVDGESAAARLEWESRSQPRQVVPETALHVRRGRTAYWTSGVKTEIYGSDDRRLEGEFFSVDDGLALRIGKRLSPGLYEAALPEEAAPFLQALTGVHGTIPFSMASDASESVLTPLSEEDKHYLSEDMGFQLARSEEDVQRALAGRSFGRELWRILAAAALLLVIGEVVLTRWIAIQRALGAEDAVTFDAAKPLASSGQRGGE